MKGKYTARRHHFNGLKSNNENQKSLAVLAPLSGCTWTKLRGSGPTPQWRRPLPTCAFPSLMQPRVVRVLGAAGKQKRLTGPYPGGPPCYAPQCQWQPCSLTYIGWSVRCPQSGAPGERLPASPSGCSPEGQLDSGWMLLEKSENMTFTALQV